ncbi:MAG: DUF1080 domain-containing protein [Daejeonella sp.]|uniref:3-keto-disaccharide hydrolase n=1 Tax=Daejeonella sp. TaxID=2805397 RepID=UPI003C7796C7
MKKLNCIILVLLAIFIYAGCSSTKSAQTSGAAGKTTQLFNGENFDGWYKWVEKRGKNIDPKNVFTIDKGLIRISGEEWGCITTNEEYSNYKLLVEFKWGDATYAPRLDRARDNGILVHSIGEDGAKDGIWMYSIEAQIIEGGTGDILVVGDGSPTFSATSPLQPKKPGVSGNFFMPGGEPITITGGRINWWGRDPAWKDVKDFRGAKDVEKPVGQWNKFEIIAAGDKLDYYLNGVLVNQAYNVKPSKGRIQIQSESAEMFVRKVEITPL